MGLYKGLLYRFLYGFLEGRYSGLGVEGTWFYTGFYVGVLSLYMGSVHLSLRPSTVAALQFYRYTLRQPSEEAGGLNSWFVGQVRKYVNESP